jgi:hypothetical protein
MAYCIYVKKCVHIKIDPWHTAFMWRSVCIHINLS